MNKLFLVMMMLYFFIGNSYAGRRHPFMTCSSVKGHSISVSLYYSEENSYYDGHRERFSMTYDGPRNFLLPSRMIEGHWFETKPRVVVAFDNTHTIHGETKDFRCYTDPSSSVFKCNYLYRSVLGSYMELKTNGNSGTFGLFERGNIINAELNCVSSRN